MLARVELENNWFGEERERDITETYLFMFQKGWNCI